MSRSVAAAFFDGDNRLAIRQVELGPPQAGEVLVDVRACGVCGSDLHQFVGRWPRPAFIPGHEIAGIVAEVGPGVTGVAVGDRVCVEPFVYCGTCRYCLTGRYFQCLHMGFLTLTAHGGFAENLLAPYYAVYRLPAEVGLELGALAEPLAVAVHGARVGAISAADGVLVLGAGTIGLMCVAAARAMGARDVYITARHPHQAQAARGLGATAVLSPDRETLLQQLGQTLPAGPDVVMEAVGSAAGTFQQALELAGKLGRIVLMGGNTTRMDGIDLTPVINKELVIYGSGCYSQIGVRRDFEVALEILAAQPEAFTPLITHRFSLAQTQAAFETALDKAGRGAIKVMVVIP